MKRKAFTMIELIIVMAIMGIVLLVVSQALFSTVNIFTQTNDNANIQNQSLVISRVIVDDIKFGTDIEILPEAPTTFDESLNYIYSDENDVIYIKAPNLGPKIIQETSGIKQSVEFSKSSERSVSVKVTLSKDSITYNNGNEVAFVNLDETDFVEGTLGNCISFSTDRELVQSIPPKIVSFKLLKSNNQSLNHDYSSKVEGTFGIVIDDDNNIIKVNMEIPLESDTKSAELVPTIAFNGDSLKVKVGDSGFREYDVRSNESIDFYNNDVFLETSNYAGEVKTYKVEIDTNVFPSITNLGVLSRNENSTTSFIIPNKKDVLTAKFDFGFEPEGYKVRWYAENKNLVSNPEELLSNYTQGKYIPDLVIDNSNILDLSEYSMLIDEYIVFFDVVSVIENGKIGEAHCSLGTR